MDSFYLISILNIFPSEIRFKILFFSNQFAYLIFFKFGINEKINSVVNMLALSIVACIMEF